MIYLEIVLYLLVGALALYPLHRWPSAFVASIKNGTAPPAFYQVPEQVALLLITLIFVLELLLWPIEVPRFMWRRYQKRTAGE